MNNQIFKEMELSTSSSENVLETLRNNVGITTNVSHSNVPVSAPVSAPVRNNNTEVRRNVSFNNVVAQKTITPPTPQPVRPVQTTSQPISKQVDTTLVEIQNKIENNGDANNTTLIAASHLLQLGKFKVPKQTLLLLLVFSLIGFGLFKITSNKSKKNNDDDDKKKNKK